jgi:hypothetical protein
VSQVCVEDYEGYDVTAPEELAAHTRDIAAAEAELTRARQEEVRRGVCARLMACAHDLTRM